MSGRPQFTITLGRSRQVVKRTGSMSDIRHSDYPTSSGTKRSIRDRLGSVVDDTISYDRQYKNKRQQTKDHRRNLSDDDMDREYMPSHQVGRNDLRFKLIQKNISKNTSSSHKKHDFDLREKLSRNTHGPLKFSQPQHVQSSQSSGQLRQIVSARSADDLCCIDTIRKPYSLTLANGQKHQSPDRHLRTSRAMSPHRYHIDAQHFPLLRSSDMLRPANHTTTNSFTSRPEPSSGNYNDTQRVLRPEPSSARTRPEPSSARTRPESSSARTRPEPSSARTRPEPSSARTSPIYVEASRPVYRASLSNQTVQPTPLKYEDHHSVSSLLHQLGLGKYAILFQAEEVDMPALKQMGDSDLKALGIPMGPRKKILLALPRPKQQQQQPPIT